MCLNSYWSLRWVSKGMSVRHLEVSDRSPKGLLSSMLVSDGSPICLRWVSDQACLSPMGL